jgi:haloalkane dehalogenase
MKNIFAILFLLGIMCGCKSYQSTISKPNQMSYTNYRSQQQSFDSQDGAIKYIDQGEGAVIVLLHGVPTSGWLYRHMIAELSKTNRVIVPDMLGYGNSDSPVGYEVYSERNHAKRLLALLDSLNIENWTHVMHDAGGLWTWETMKIAPDRMNKLVILNSIIYEEGFDPPIKFKEGFIAKTAMWAYRNGLTTNMMLNGLFKTGMKENTLTKIDLEGYKTPLKKGKTRAMYYFFTQTCNTLPNYSEILKKSNIPTTIIWGAKDEFLLWEPQKQRVLQDLKISEENVHILDAKHFIQEEKPTEIVAIIQGFIN